MEESEAFSRFAIELRAIEADSPYDGEFYLHEICATAARLASKCNASGLVHICAGELSPNPVAIAKAPIDSPEPWYQVWLSVCRIMQAQYPDKIHRNVAVGRVTFHNQGPLSFADLKDEKGITLSIGSIALNNQSSDGLDEGDSITCMERSPRDWKQRATRFAAVCDLLAKLTAPTPIEAVTAEHLAAVLGVEVKTIQNKVNAKELKKQGGLIAQSTYRYSVVRAMLAKQSAKYDSRLPQTYAEFLACPKLR